jgi:hypothetical protein
MPADPDPGWASKLASNVPAERIYDRLRVQLFWILRPAQLGTLCGRWH